MVVHDPSWIPYHHYQPRSNVGHMMQIPPLMVHSIRYYPNPQRIYVMYVFHGYLRQKYIHTYQIYEGWREPPPYVIDRNNILPYTGQLTYQYGYQMNPGGI